MLAAAGLVATALFIVVGATLLIVGVALGAVALVVRAVLPASWRRPTPPAPTPWPQETIEATIVESRDAEERELLHIPATKDKERR
jgi:hypothetical protein